MSAPDAVLFVVPGAATSAGALARLERAALAATTGPARLVRLEGTGPSLIDALDAMRAAGHARIRVQPLGLPFPEGLAAWLPGVLAHWRGRGENADTALTLGPDPARDEGAVAALAAAALAGEARDAATARPSLGKPGWNDPPDFDVHLLVCTGPRCAVHGAGTLVRRLKDECAAAGVSDRCLIARTGCLYPCNRGPLVVLYPHGRWHRLPDDDAVRAFVRRVLVEGGDLPEHRFHTARLARDDLAPFKAGAAESDAPLPSRPSAPRPSGVRPSASRSGAVAIRSSRPQPRPAGASARPETAAAPSPSDDPSARPTDRAHAAAGDAPSLPHRGR